MKTKDLSYFRLTTTGGAKGFGENRKASGTFVLIAVCKDGTEVVGQRCTEQYADLRTSNQAAYFALCQGLRYAKTLFARMGTKHKLVVHSNSQLMCSQLNGDAKVKSANLKELYAVSKELIETTGAELRWRTHEEIATVGK